VFVDAQAKITCPGDSDAGKPAETIGQQIVRAAERIRYLVQLKFYREADLYSDPAVASILNPANAAFKSVWRHQGVSSIASPNLI
jgi:hypothetical protein